MSVSFGCARSTMNFEFRISVLILVILYPLFTFCQQTNKDDSKYEWFDSLIGETNSGLFEGQVYYDVYNVRENRHQFLNTSQFQKGSATYIGQGYFNLDLRYDVFNDNVIVRNKEIYWTPPMIFDSDLLLKFSIERNEFVNLRTSISDGETGFFEIILRLNSSRLLKKHKKKLFVKTEDEILYHEFKDDFKYYLQQGSTYFKLRSSKDLNAIFPEHKKAIKLLEKKHRVLKKSDFGIYLKSILVDLEKELPTSIKTQE